MTIRTILVDDEKLAIQGLQLRLEAFPDVEVIDTCSNGREAIRKIKTEKPDLVFCDIQMPGFDGFSVVKGVMEIDPPLFVFVTAYSEHAIKAFEANAIDYLLKPVEVDRLADALDRALRGGPAWVARRPQDPVASTITAPVGAESSATAATRITVLGSGASRGVPRVGCRCGVCLSRDQRNRRLRSSVLVEWLDGVTERGVIIDPGMDLRQQALRHGVTRLDGALVTHIHVDHTGGIDELRAYTDAQDAVLPIGAGEATADELRKRWEYAVDGRTPPGAGIPALQLVASDEAVTIAGRSFQAISIVHGKRPAHGWRSGGFAYLTDVSYIPAASRDLLGDLDLLIVSALRDLPHPTHQTVDEALELIRAVAPRRALLTHLDHDLDFEDLAARLPAGVAPAFDGLVVEVPAR